MSNKTTLITGASTGIGYELSRLFARDGYDLVLVARNEQKLNQMAGELQKKFGISVKVMACDLSTPVADKIYEQLKDAPIEILVNNAGSSVYGPFAETNLDKELHIIQLNIATLTSLTKYFLRGMVQRGHGKILNLGSTGSFVPGPLNAVYCATKAYVLSFSEALAEELQGTGVTVTALCPGQTQTEFAKNAKVEKTRLFLSSPMQAAVVAECGYRGLISGKRLVIPGFSNQMTAFLPKFFPRRVVAQVSKYLMSEVN